jgi:hypothetical protein
MTALRARWAGIVVCALAVVGCAPPHGGAVPRSLSSASPSPTPETLVALLDRPFGAAPNTLRLLRTDGVEVAETSVDPDAEAIAVAGSRVLMAGSGQLRAIDRDGTASALPTVPAAADGSLIRGLVASPDGSRWMWASVVQSDRGVDSRLYEDSAGTAPALLLQRHETGSALQPVAWTAGGVVVSDEPLGIGGYVLFRRTFGVASLLGAAGHMVQLTAGDCAFSDLAADGSVTCIRNGREGPHTDAPVSLLIQRPGNIQVTVDLPATVAQAGDAYFRPDGAVVSLGISPALGEGSEQIETDLVDATSGARHAFGPTGIMPAGWLPDGRLLAVRLPGVAGGPAGTFVVAADGTATQISTAATVIGILR